MIEMDCDIKILEPLSKYKHRWALEQSSSMEIVYKCTKCAMICIANIEPEKTDLKVKLSIEESLSCDVYLEKLSEVISTHSFDIANGVHNYYYCTECEVEGISHSGMNRPTVLFKAEFANTLLLSCSEVKLHSVLI